MQNSTLNSYNHDNFSLKLNYIALLSRTLKWNNLPFCDLSKVRFRILFQSSLSFFFFLSSFLLSLSSFFQPASTCWTCSWLLYWKKGRGGAGREKIRKISSMRWRRGWETSWDRLRRRIQWILVKQKKKNLQWQPGERELREVEERLAVGYTVEN